MHEYISQWLRKWDLHPYTWNLILVGAALVLGLVITLIFSIFVKKDKNESVANFLLTQSLLKHLRVPVSYLIPTLLFDFLLPALQVSNMIRRRIDHALEVMVIIFATWFIIRLIRVGQDIVHNKISINNPNNLRQRRILTQLMYIRRVLVILIVLIAIGAILLTFDTMRKIGTGLLTGVGIGGIIIGFAAQRSLGNLLAGFQIAFTQPIRIDDEVIVDGQFGVIEEITLTYVVVKSWDERRIILPINYFIEQRFENWTRTRSELTGTVFFYTDYSLPVDWFRSQFMKVVKASPLWDGRAASLAVTNLTESVMEIRGIVTGKNSGDVFNLRCHLREELVKRINEHFPDSLPITRAVLVKDAVKSLGDDTSQTG